MFDRNVELVVKLNKVLHDVKCLISLTRAYINYQCCVIDVAIIITMFVRKYPLEVVVEFVVVRE